MKINISILAWLLPISSIAMEYTKPSSTITDMKNFENQHIRYRLVSFPSVGALLTGKLYTPAGPEEKRPIIIMAHGFSATITNMVADTYAEKFYEAGFAVLLFDHRNFGSSGGEPRQELNFWVQCRGYIDALNFVGTLDHIDFEKIAVWGDSLSSAEVLAVGAVDKRIAAIIGQVPAFGDDPVSSEEVPGLLNKIETLLMDEHLEDLEVEGSEAIAVVSPSQEHMASALKELSAFRWFMEYGGRYNSKWENRVSFATFKKAPKPYHRGIPARLLKAPILLVIAREDEMEGASSAVARSVFEQVTQPKQLVEVDGGHFGLLEYPGEVFDQSSKAQIEFLINLFR